MAAPKDFAAFILTHGRPDRVHTYATLRRIGYTGRIYLLVDDLDKTREQYVERYGDEVIVFDKKAVAKTFDQGDNFQDMRAIIYARNASFAVAKMLGIKHFVELDDDYTKLDWRFDSRLDYGTWTVRAGLDEIFSAVLEFMLNSGADSVALAQGGDFIGGSQCPLASSVKLRRKCMNSFFCSTERPFQFVGRVNEDVNTYTRAASTGKVFFTVNHVSLVQKQTQSNSGGMTELYLDSGTYVKSFYSIMYHPSSVKIGLLRDGNGSNGGRLHHQIAWKNTTPMILRESLKKREET